MSDRVFSWMIDISFSFKNTFLDDELALSLVRAIKSKTTYSD